MDPPRGERSRAELAMELLAEAGVTLAVSLDLDATLRRAAELAVPWLGDWCVIDAIDESGSLKRLSWAHREPASEPLLRTLVERYPPRPDSPQAAATAVRTGSTVFLPAAAPELSRYSYDREHAQLLGALGARSLLAVPLVAGGRPIGALTLGTGDGRVLDDLDVRFADELARRIALALANARLYRDAEGSRRRAEESFARLEALLDNAPVGIAFVDSELRVNRINAALARLQDLRPEDVVGRSVRELLLERGASLRMGSNLADAAAIEALIRGVLETGAPLTNLELDLAAPGGGRAAYLVSFYLVKPHDTALGVGAVIVDITARKNVEADQARLIAAERTARAAAEEAQERLTLLAEATHRLALSLDWDTTIREVVRLTIGKFSEWCVAFVLDEHGAPKLAGLAFANPEDETWIRAMIARYPVTLDVPTGVGYVLRTGQSELLAELPDPGRFIRETTRSKEFADAAAARPRVPRSHLCVPLVARGKTTGALSFGLTTESPRPNYGPADLALAEEIGRRVAVALDNAALHRDALEAVRVRDEFLTLASHELKTPLTSLKLRIQGLGRLRGEGSIENLREALSAAARQVDRLALLVDNLLDVSRLTTGRLELSAEDGDLAVVTRRVVERLGPELERARCKVRLHTAPVSGAWDVVRVEQILVNLLSNAIKYGAGRPIDVHVEADHGNARVSVHDEGIGIDPEDIERIFGRFERAVSYRHFGGLGLGLFVSRQIAEAHGGALSVKSRKGEGSTFTLTLPRRRAA